MHQMQAEYVGSLRTQALHLDSKNQIITDAPKDNQGNGAAFSPTDLLCTSLASCMLTIMAMRARAKNIELAGIVVDIQKIMQPTPRKVAEVVLTFHWNGVDKRLNPEQLEELKQAGLTCPVALSLDPSVKKTMHW